MARKSLGWMPMNIAGERTVRERAYDHEECEGCGSRKKPVYTYLGQDGEPIVCSKPCFEKAMVKRFGGVRKPTREQAEIIRERDAAKVARRAQGSATVRRLHAV